MKLCPVCNSQLPDNQEVPELVPLDYHEDALALSIKRRIAAEEKLRWIPVSERLPTENDANGINFKILVLFSNGVVDLWNPILVNEHFDLQIKHTYITHWMTLPNPPQEVE